MRTPVSPPAASGAPSASGERHRAAGAPSGGPDGAPGPAAGPAAGRPWRAGPARPAGICAVAVALLGGVLGVDALLSRLHPGLAGQGLLDELGHLGTAGLLLLGAAALWPRGMLLARRRWWGRPGLRAVLAGSVVIDVDHVPAAVFGSSVLSRGTPRPYPHCLLTVALLAVLAALLAGAARVRRGGRLPAVGATIAAGLAVGVLLHFVRDLVTAPVPLWWPWSDTGVQLPYRDYAALLVAVTAGVCLGSSRLARTA